MATSRVTARAERARRGWSTRRVACGALVVAVAGACGGEGALVRPPGAPLAQRVAPEAKAIAAGVPTVRVVLDDPRFAAVNERLRAKDAPGAARAFVEARATVPPDATRACAFDYVEGRLDRDAGDDDDAARAFDRVPSDCALFAHASYYAAGAYARAGRADDAIDRARRVPSDATVATEAKLVEAEALAAKGDRAAALAIWRAHLAANPHGARWVDTAVKIANALLDGDGTSAPGGRAAWSTQGNGDVASHAREALDVATRVVVEVPKYADTTGGQAARERAVAALRLQDPRFDDALSPADRARRAQGWLDANEPQKAVAEATPVASRTGPEACKAAIVRAQATMKLPRQSAAAADAYGEAIARCAGDDALVTALFAGAKASAAARRTDEAIDRFAKVEAQFPHHRFADDARLRAALLVQPSDPARAEQMLEALERDYPEGDMRGEALFRVALMRMARGDWEGAKGPLDRIVAIEPDDRRGATTGRAAYFRARAAAMTGDADDAARRYEAVIGSTPLAFYMAQAYARLSAIDPARARRAMEDAVARASQVAPSPLLTREHPELASPAFARGVALLEVGELDDARRELNHGVGDSTDPEVLWAIALLYEEAGAPELGEGLVHAKLGSYAGHWPVARWRACWEIAFPRPFGDLVEKASAASGIPTVLTWAIMREESQFDPDAKSPADAYGLMQIIVPTARGLVKGTPFGADPDSLKRPEVSITLGAKLLGGLRASYPTNKALAIAAYNGGGGAVGRWLAARPQEDFDLWVEEIPFDETRGYVKRVLANEAAYAFLYAPAAIDEVLALPEKVRR